MANKDIQIRACKKFFQIIENPKTDLEKLARRSMLESMSYQLPEAARFDRLIGFKELWRSFRVAESEVLPPTSTPFLILDGRDTKAQLRKEYSESIHGKQFSFVSRTGIRTKQGDLGNAIKLRVFVKGLKVAVRVFFSSKNRVNLALKHRSIRELLALVALLDKSEIRELHDYNQYEIDSNLFYLVIKEVFRDAIHVFKYPSPGPLYLHNSILLTDTIGVNHGYHEEEVKRLTDIRYSELKKVPPEGYFQYEKYYTHQSKQPEFDLGYYSHAGWLRLSEGHADDGLGIADSENTLLKELVDVIRQNDSVRSLKVFLHPREKMQYDHSIEHYKSVIGSDISVEFSDMHENSTHCFDQVKVGIGVYSAILFERLILGRSTLIFGGNDNFPMRDSPLKNIFCNRQNMSDHIIMALKVDQTSFFADNDIEYMKLSYA